MHAKTCCNLKTSYKTNDKFYAPSLPCAVFHSHVHVSWTTFCCMVNDMRGYMIRLGGGAWLAHECTSVCACSFSVRLVLWKRRLQWTYWCSAHIFDYSEHFHLCEDISDLLGIPFLDGEDKEEHLEYFGVFICILSIIYTFCQLLG